LTQVEGPIDEQFKSVRTMRCVTRPFDGHADCLRIFPAQELAPGWYELSPIGTFMVSPKDYIKELVNRTTFVGVVVASDQEHKRRDTVHDTFNTYASLSSQDQVVTLLKPVATNIEKGQP